MLMEGALVYVEGPQPAIGPSTLGTGVSNLYLLGKDESLRRCGRSGRASRDWAAPHSPSINTVGVVTPSLPIALQGLAAVEVRDLGDQNYEQRAIRRSLEDSVKARRAALQDGASSMPRAKVASAADRDLLAAAQKTDIRTVKVLGEGAFGIVDLVRVHTPAGQLLCVRKKLLKANESNNNDPAREVEALEAVRDCSFVTQLWSSVVGLYDYTLLMEYCPYGSLEGLLRVVSWHRSATGNACLDFVFASLLRLERRAGLTEDEARFYTACILIALEDIHSRGYVHRDVKPSNCMLAESRYLKLGDLGLAKHLEAGTKAHSQVGGMRADIGHVHFRKTKRHRLGPLYCRGSGGAQGGFEGVANYVSMVTND
ncbi:hypothetical protein Vretifemale_10090 [Volvox reticuliferus]|uniref:Protein kinase domain-containing protein n=1 Tax=Volvox reticuliferus TaxID=1737510 RepID=A0A8J4CFV8_9CHLO|nr:hypothetical protein Vretifemale_10090 [Volvox reticuliferus]